MNDERLSFKMHRKILVLLGFNRIRMQDSVSARAKMIYVHETYYVLIEKISLNVLAGMTNPQSHFSKFTDSAQHIVLTLYTSIYMRF